MVKTIVHQPKDRKYHMSPKTNSHKKVENCSGKRVQRRRFKSFWFEVLCILPPILLTCACKRWIELDSRHSAKAPTVRNTHNVNCLGVSNHFNRRVRRHRLYGKGPNFASLPIYQSLSSRTKNSQSETIFFFHGFMLTIIPANWRRS